MTTETRNKQARCFSKSRAVSTRGGFQLSQNFPEARPYVALLLAQTFRLVIFEPGSFRKMIWYIRAIFLNQQTYRNSGNIPERTGAAMTLFSPFLQPSMFPSLFPFFPLWNNLILYVQKWLVKNIALVGLMAPVRDCTWAGMLPVIHSEWLQMSVAINCLQISKFLKYQLSGGRILVNWVAQTPAKWIWFRWTLKLIAF